MNVIIISSDIVNSKMAGPGIRYLEIARSLSKKFNVTLLTPNECDLKEEYFVIATFNKSTLLEMTGEIDCILIQGRTLWENSYIKKMKTPLIIDLYDPFIFEELEVNANGRNLDVQNQLHKSSMSVLIDQLQWGDYFICATEKQKDLWIGMLTGLNRINPLEYEIDKSFDHLIGVVPFGLSNSTPRKDKKVMKGIIPNIKNEDKIILWGGGVWDWLDPKTAIEAIEILLNSRTDIKLFFMGINHPNPRVPVSNKVKELIKYTELKNLKDKYVFFNDWVDYNERHNYLLESDIGLNVHLNHIETRFAFRTRLLDYIWCELPILTTEGDIISEYVSNHNIGNVIPVQNANELARNIEYLLDNPPSFNNFSKLKESLDWNTTTICLQNYILSKPTISKGKSMRYKIKGTYSNMYSAYILNGINLLIKGEKDLLIRKIRSFIYRKK
ncbi:glycosyltransferase [Psychrobacillus sp. FSL H8-0510]|uniref:glycosyltransferase n=1 Tax=Psychrobacillus sp. FSL H8-0510 TaxID=2921394 RepID=UPI0030F84913